MEMVWQVLFTSLPTLFLAGMMVLLVKKFLDQEVKNNQLRWIREQKKETLGLRVQAYERLVMLLERSKFQSLLQRNSSQKEKPELMVFSMHKMIEGEWEHNVSQQIFVSDIAWSAVRKAVTDQKHLLMMCLSELKTSGKTLTELYEKHATEYPHTSMDEALEILGLEAKKNF